MDGRKGDSFRIYEQSYTGKLAFRIDQGMRVCVCVCTYTCRDMRPHFYHSSDAFASGSGSCT